MALQRYGDVDMAALLREMESWSEGKLLERRAVVAGLCEPRLLKDSKNAARVLQLLDHITASLLSMPIARRLRIRRAAQGARLLAGASPPWRCRTRARRLMEKWFGSADKDIRWIMRENLGKTRLARLDAAWVEKWKTSLGR